MADKDSVVYIQAAFPLPPRASLKHGLTVGHTCSMKETEWGRPTGAHGGM